MKDFLRHLFIPHKSNNYRAKILQHSTLALLIIFLFLGTFSLSALKVKFPEVLGISTDITSEQLLVLVNQKREENGFAPLVFNPELSAAALNKSNDMLSKNYWAHNSPEGRTPWEFIKESGYNYIYAGESLARGFTTSSSVTDAWMASSSHRANMLSPNYSDVGFAVMTGRLDGEETVLVVEEFGSRNLAYLPSTRQAQTESSPNVQKIEAQQPLPEVARTQVAASKVVKKSIIDSRHLASNLNTLIIFGIIFAFISEMIILERKKLYGFARHNPDHVFFLVSVLLILIILGRGVVI